MTKTKIGDIAVDSGQIMIADPCYINADFVKEFDPGQLGEFDDAPAQDQYEMNYDGCCNATLNKNGFGQLGNEFTNKLGIACRTMWGDGVYPVYAETDRDGRIKTITIDFDPVPDDELCPECGTDLYNDYCDCDGEDY